MSHILPCADTCLTVRCRYGTELGVVYATLFPENVGNMVLDGVVDVDAWFAGNASTSIVATDAAVEAFYQTCFEAGPGSCAFYDSSPEKISANLDALYERVATEPVPAFSAAGFGLVDYNILRQAVFNAITMPVQLLPTLALGLAQLSAGNGSIVFGMGQVNPFACGLNDMDLQFNSAAAIAVICNDAQTLNMTLDGWQEYYKEAAEVSQYADIWVQNWMQCQYAKFSSRSTSSF